MIHDPTQQDIVDLGPKKGDPIPDIRLRYLTGDQYLVPTYGTLISDHCFIPTVSGLGLTNPNRDLAENLSTRDLVCSAETPFDAYYAPLSENQGHITLNPANVAFLTKEILSQTPTPVFPATQFFVCIDGTSAVIGVAPECSAARSGAAQPLTDYVWTAGPELQIVSGQGTAAVTVKAVSNGASFLTVMATRRGGYTSSSTTVKVQVGQIAATGTFSSMNATNKPLQSVNYVTPGDVRITLSGPYDFTFTSSSSSILVNKGGPQLAGFYLQAGQGVQITASYGGDCGVFGSFAFTTNDGYSYSFAPNPASSELTVTASGEGQPAEPFDADLYDSFGKKVKTKKSEQGKAVLDVRDLPNGLYNLRAGKGN